MRSVIATYVDLTRAPTDAQLTTIRGWLSAFDITTVPWGSVHCGEWGYSVDTSDFGLLFERTGVRGDNLSCYNPVGLGDNLGVNAGVPVPGSYGFASNQLPQAGGGTHTFYCSRAQMQLAAGCRYFLVLTDGDSRSTGAIRVCQGFAGSGIGGDTNLPIELPMPDTSLAPCSVVPILTFDAFNQWITGPTPHITVFGPHYKFNQVCCHPTTVDPFYGCGQSPP